ncbi:MAG: hypothetical protein HY689_08915, partial [Chloroflexi bacterium]|nr:hypothetical protein [Chloroflexota bacterium]
AVLTGTAELSQQTNPVGSGVQALSLVYRVPPTSSPAQLEISVAGQGAEQRMALSLAPEDAWRHAWLDVTGLRGTLTVRIHLSGAAPVLWLDEVSLGP